MNLNSDRRENSISNSAYPRSSTHSEVSPIESIHSDNRFPINKTHNAPVRNLCSEIPQVDETQPRISSQSLDSSATANFVEVDVPIGWVDKLGWWTTSVFVLSSVVILASLACLIYLWVAPHSSLVWVTIMSQGWGNQAVSILSLLIRNAADLQIGIAVAMLAALALEAYRVRLYDAAGVSMMRAGNSTPWTLILPLFRGATLRLDTFTYLIPATILLISTILLQFTSTALLADLRIGSLPGLTAPVSVLYDLNISAATQDYYKQFLGGRGHLTPWMRNPTRFPAFAEFSEPGMPGVDDTGRLLRAFVPATETSARESLQSYSGDAHVLDARVVCLPPKFLELSWGFRTWPDQSDISGRVSYYENINITKFVAPDEPIRFRCPMQAHSGTEDSYSICEIDEAPQTSNPLAYGIFLASSLMSEFMNIPLDDGDSQFFHSNRRYLVMHKAIPKNITGFENYGTGYENYDSLSYEKNASQFVRDQQWTHVPAMQQNASYSYRFSMCFPAWDVRPLPVVLTSTSNRTEPQMLFNCPVKNSSICIGDEFWDPSQILKQLHPNASVSHEERGIMQLQEKNSWVVPSRYKNFPGVTYGISWVQVYGGMKKRTIEEISTSSFILGFGGDTTQRATYADKLMVAGNQLDFNFVDTHIGVIFLRALEKTGSLAWAISDLITVLSSMVYYEHLPRFTTSTTANQASYITVQFPQAFQGLIAVIVVTFVHLATVTVIMALFLTGTRYTLLDNSWMCVAQLMRPELNGVLKGRTIVKDSMLEREMEKHSNLDKRVGIGMESGSIRLRVDPRRHGTW